MLAPLARQRLRARLAGAEQDNPSDLLRAAVILTERVRAYFNAIEYSPPRSDSAYPTALAARPGWNGSGTDRRRFIVGHFAIGAQRLWDEAGAMCLDAAFFIAEWELTSELPEAAEVIRLAAVAAANACKNAEFSGMQWATVCRRYGTKGIRAMLDKVLSKLPGACMLVFPDAGVPVLQTAESWAAARKGLDALASSLHAELRFAIHQP